MNDTQQQPGSTGTEADFDPHRLRTITDMRRSSDDRVLGGVCAGAARYLDIDPVVVRVVIGVLTFVGLAGLVLYVAAWFLLPSDDAERSVAADWFNLDRNEPQVRKAGLLIAAIVAGLSIVGDTGWAWGGTPWILVPLAPVALLYHLFAVRARRRRDLARPTSPTDPGTPPVPPVGDVARNAAGAPLATPASAATTTAPLPPVPPGPGATAPPAVPTPPCRPRRRFSPALLGLTLSVMAIAVAVTRIVADAHGGTPWTTYVAVALAVTGLGLVAGAFVGSGLPLVPIGLVLTAVLAIGTLLPSPRVGQDFYEPRTVADLDRRYEHGMGEVRLDLTQLDDATALAGRTVEIESGVGKIEVRVPDDLAVDVRSQLDFGEIKVFDRRTSGTDNRLDVDGGPGALTLDLDLRVGQIEVVTR